MLPFSSCIELEPDGERLPYTSGPHGSEQFYFGRLGTSCLKLESLRRQFEVRRIIKQINALCLTEKLHSTSLPPSLAFATCFPIGTMFTSHCSVAPKERWWVPARQLVIVAIQACKLPLLFQVRGMSYRILSNAFIFYRKQYSLSAQSFWKSSPASPIIIDIRRKYQSCVKFNDSEDSIRCISRQLLPFKQLFFEVVKCPSRAR